MFAKRRQDDIAEVSNSVSFYALISLIVMFVVIVAYGWSTMLVPVISLPSGWSDFLSPIFTLLRYAVGLAIAVAGVLFGKAVAAERIRISAEEEAKFKNTWKAYFIVLFVISALGTMNTMFVYTQGSYALSEAISKTRNHLQQLKFRIDDRLATSNYDQQRADIAQLFGNFEKELRNPANCGFGAQSNMRFRELQVVLPKLKPLSLGSGACANVGEQITSYRQIVEALMDDLPDPATKKRYQQRKAFSTQIEKTITDIEEIKVQNASLDKAVVVPALAAAWITYERILREAELTSGSSFELPAKIVDKNAQSMGDITQIIPLLIEHSDDPKTYVIIGAALLFDILLIQFFSRYLHSRTVVRRETTYTPHLGRRSERDTNLFEEERRYDN